MAQDKPLLSNFSEYTLAAGLAIEDTSVVLESTAGLPTISDPSDYIPMVLRDATNNREIIHVTAVDTNTNVLTVIRGREGTSAQEWSASAYVYVTLTAEAAMDLQAYAAALAEDWATEDEDIEVEAGKYSAYHHAQKAAASASAASASESNASDSETNAGTSETNAAASEAKAADWAEKAEDSEVEPGLYSALHHALKAAASAASAAESALSAIAPGIYVPFAGTVLPEGYLWCNGGAVSRTTYANLFAAIGTRWGEGDGSTTFNVPDFRNRSVKGWDGTADTVGAFEDEMVKSHDHTASTGTNGSHSHSGSATSNGNHTHNYQRMQPGVSSYSTGGVSTQIGLFSYATTSNGEHSHSLSINSNGNHTHTVSVDASGGIENRVKSNLSPFIIKY